MIPNGGRSFTIITMADDVIVEAIFFDFPVFVGTSFQLGSTMTAKFSLELLGSLGDKTK